jgi:hypothetical protein
LRLSLEVDFDLGGVEGIETHFNGLAGEMRWSLVEMVVQQEGAILTYEAIEAIEEKAAEVGRGREWTYLLDIALPAQQRSGSQGRVLGAVIGVVDPGPEAGVEVLQGKQQFRGEIAQELISHAAEKSFDFAAPLGLIGGRMDDEDADRCGNAGQLLRAIDLGIVDVEADGHAPGCDSLAEAIQGGIQSLVWIELGVRDETACVIKDGMKEDLHLAAAGALDVRAKEHVGLPDLVAVLSLELFVCRRSEELTFGQAALLEETVKGGRRDYGVVLPRGKSKFPKQCGAGTMRVFTFEISIKSASCGVITRDWPRSCRG